MLPDTWQLRRDPGANRTLNVSASIPSADFASVGFRAFIKRRALWMAVDSKTGQRAGRCPQKTIVRTSLDCPNSGAYVRE